MPSFSISVWLPALTSCATRSRSRMICSTVNPPTMDRRWPAKIRPTSSSIRACSVRNRRAALAMERWSSPTLNTVTARTVSRMPCWVTQSSAISASRSASDSIRAFCLTGITKLPCPVTIRNWVSWACRLDPEISNASLGAGTCQNNITGSSRLGERYDHDGARRSVLHHHHQRVPGDRPVRPGRERLAAAAHRHQHLAGPVRRDRDRDPADRADRALVRLLGTPIRLTRSPAGRASRVGRTSAVQSNEPTAQRSRSKPQPLTRPAQPAACRPPGAPRAVPR